METDGARERWPIAALFDFDGLLVETRAAWQSAYEAVLGSDGRVLDAEQLRELNGASVRSAAEELRVPASLLRGELERALTAEALQPLPGARFLLELLKSRMRLAVATNGPGSAVISALKGVGLLEYFDCVVSAEDEPRDKPWPDVYLAACRALGVHPSDSIAFEDSAIGVASARRAGLVVVYVPSDGAERTDADLQVRRLDDPTLLSYLGHSGAGQMVTDDTRAS